MMTHALTHFLNPQSVALIGVSPNPSFINAILNNLLRWQYDRPIYPVNPNYRDIAGLPAMPVLTRCRRRWTWRWCRCRAA
jgi:acyl-CoA synthetase (NDP forming)